MTQKTKFVTGDIWLASALSLFLNITPEFKLENSRCLFVFPSGDNTFRAISEYNGGKEINAYEYAQVIKKLKVEMLTRRQQGPHCENR